MRKWKAHIPYMGGARNGEVEVSARGMQGAAVDHIQDASTLAKRGSHVAAAAAPRLNFESIDCASRRACTQEGTDEIGEDISPSRQRR